MQLKRSIGTCSLLFAAVGGIVGSGWLLGPFFAAKLAGPAAVLSWLIGGCLMMVIALTFAELASSFPVAGGTVRFLQFSHGSLVSFSMAWIGWLASLAIAPIETMALLHYASSYLPGLMHVVGGTRVLSAVGIVSAGALLFLICVINSLGVKVLAKTNSLVVMLKLLVPIATILILVTFSFHADNFVFGGGFVPLGLKGVFASLPSAGVIFSFIGYSPAIQLAGEAKNPSRSIPIAIIGGLLLCILLYILLQVVFVGALDFSALSNGWDRLSFSGDAGPFAGIAMSLGLAWFAKLLFVDAAVSPFGTALIHTATASRICYGLGKNGFLPQAMLKLNRFGIPVRVVALNFLMGLLLFLPFPSWQRMMGFLVSALVFAYAVGPLSLVVLRKTLPNRARPFKVPVPYFFCLLAFYICNLIIFWTGWLVVSKMLIAMGIGYIVLIVYKNTQHGAQLHLHCRKAWWVFCYIIALGVLTYLGSFGGGRHVIAFGWDFPIIALVSWIIFELSQRCALGTDEAEEQINEAVELL